MLSLLVLLAGCQSSPSATGPAPVADDRVLLSAQHCLDEYLKDLRRKHYGPCLKVVAVDGEPPVVRDDGFIELPVATAITLDTSCVYRHADGTPIPATITVARFEIGQNTFTKAGKRWYLHAHKQARGVVGCEPTLSTSVYPSHKTN